MKQTWHIYETREALEAAAPIPREATPELFDEWNHYLNIVDEFIDSRIVPELCPEDKTQIGVNESYFNSNEFAIGLDTWDQISPKTITLINELLDQLPEDWSVILSSGDPFFDEVPLYWFIMRRSEVWAYSADQFVYAKFGIAIDNP